MNRQPLNLMLDRFTVPAEEAGAPTRELKLQKLHFEAQKGI